MPQKACDHQWTYVEGGPYDAEEDAACYRDGLNYVPPGSYTVCTKCGKRWPAHDHGTGWDLPFIVALPFIILYMLFIGVFGPLIILISAIYDELFARKRPEEPHRSPPGLGKGQQ